MNLPLSLIRFVLAVAGGLVLAMLWSCGGGKEEISVEPVSDHPAVGTGFSLPAPSAVKGSAYVSQGLERIGTEHLLPSEFHAKWISDSGDVCTFNPDWVAGSETQNRLALAAYAFTVAENFDDAQRIEFALPQTGEPGDMWVGLSNWELNCWDWFQPLDDRVETPLTAYINPENNELLVATAFTGTDPWQVETITVGGKMLVDGYVYASDGVTPMEGVEVTMRNQESPVAWDVQTGPDGYWSMEWSTYYALTVSASQSGFGFAPQEQEAIVDGTDVRLEPFIGTLLPTVTVDGFVYLEDGTTPVAGCPVQAWGASDSYEVFTDDSGYYRFNEICGGELLVRPYTLAYMFSPAEQTLQATESLVADPFLAAPQPEFNIEGYVLKDDGVTPVVGADVFVYCWSPVFVSVNLMTDETGYYSTSGLFPADYSVTAQKTGYTFTPRPLEFSLVDQDLTLGLIEGTCPPQYRLSGSVRDYDTHEPIADVKVEIVDLIVYHTAYTDENGDFEIAEVFEGNYRVMPHKANYRFIPSEEYVELDRNRSVSLRGQKLATVTVDGCVVDQQTFEPVPDVDVRFMRGEGEITVTTDANGYYSTQLCNGTWYARPWSSCWSMEPVSRKVKIEGEPQTLELFYAYPGGGG